MTAVQERLYVEAPYVQTVGVFERRLGIAPGTDHGECMLTLGFPVGKDHEIARTVTAKTQRLAGAANYTSRYRVAWDAGRTARGIPTPAFEGTLTIAAGEDYDETALEIAGSYDPPGGPAGQAFDELLGRRVMHATMSALLAGVGEELRAAHAHIEAGKQAP
jgi:hypothetical protein